LVYLFFSIIVETKTAGYVFIVSPLLLFIFAMSFQLINDYLTNRLYKPLVFGITVVAIIFSVAVSIRFETLNSFHSKGVSNYNWENRENKIHNTQIYKSLDSYLKGSYLVFNCKSMESVDAMFYSNQNVYAWWPEKSVYDSLKALNYKIAAFTKPQQSSIA
jgi:HKD family nuclease